MILNKSYCLLILVMAAIRWYEVTCDSGSLNMGSTEDSDEDTKLKQALFLIDLLKSDYAKALRENEEMRRGNISDSTCATTQEAQMTDGSITTSPTMPAVTPTSQSLQLPQAQLPPAQLPPEQLPSAHLPPAQLPPAQLPIAQLPIAQLPPAQLSAAQLPPAQWPQEQNMTPAQLLPSQWATPPVLHQFSQIYRRRNPYSYFRRRNPDNYYYYELNNFRRFADEQEVRPSYTAASMTTVSRLPSEATSSATVTAVTSSSAGTITRTTKSSFKPVTHAANKTTKSLQKHVALRQNGGNPDPENINNTTTDNTQDPISNQVATELMNEFKIDMMEIHPKHKLPQTSHTLKVTKKKRDWLTKRRNTHKSSLKIYLHRSTRYPVPLPENHAFCYTNPNNALCRTQL